MKKAFLLLPVLLALLCAACAGSDYSPFVYTNESGTDISFKTAEQNSPKYILGAAGSLSLPVSITLDSDVRGRSEIMEIDSPYVTWTRHGGNIYDIRFVQRKSYKVEFRNYTKTECVLIEQNGLLSPSLVTVAGATDTTPGSSAETVRLYTEKPLFKPEGYTWTVKYHYRNGDETFIVGINPSGENWWE
jgi:hypothetical protein